MALTFVSVLREFELQENPSPDQAQANQIFDSFAYGPDGHSTRFSRVIQNAQAAWVGSQIVGEQGEVLGSGEDPRAFFWRDSPCISAPSHTREHGHINKIYVHKLRKWFTLVPPKKMTAGKNWAPFVWNGDLHFVHSYSPFRVLKARFLSEQDDFMVLERVAEHRIPTPKSFDRFSKFRGGSNALQWGNRVLGVGHTNERQGRASDTMIHRPFLFVYEPEQSVTYYAIDYDYPTEFRIVDPTSLFAKNGELHLVTCETEFIWDRTPQRGRSCLYHLDIKGDFDENSTRFRSRRLHRWAHGESSKIRRILGPWR
ncbi:MAG: hypothetical protein P8J33_13360 [Pirellulaceae bacterium]|nr:hypothetical protein [Pirellulaceae bacterium]